MSTKREVLEQAARGEGCLGKAADDEPVFVLRAKDPAAALVVRIWCNVARSYAFHEPEKIAGAEIQATAMQAWRDRRGLQTVLRTNGDDD